MIKKFAPLVLISVISFVSCPAMSEAARAKSFVYLEEVDPTIAVSLRYSTTENFLATPVDGYKKPKLMLTKAAAQALKQVQADVKKDGFSLVIYDAYRPQQAVDHFIRWADNAKDQVKKAQYYPRVDKEKVFELGYVGKKSSHSRGSTLDLTLIKVGKALHAIQEQKRTLRDGYTITFLDDGTVDMGSSFDLFDPASHFENNLIEKRFHERRTYLKTIMEKHGFKPYENEWWHFTLKNEPYPADQESSYFNFAIE